MLKIRREMYDFSTFLVCGKLIIEKTRDSEEIEKVSTSKPAAFFYFYFFVVN